MLSDAMKLQSGPCALRMMSLPGDLQGFVTQFTRPAARDSALLGALALGFTYTNDSGTVKTGTVSVPYTATP
jgi:hypothetical protein